MRQVVAVGRRGRGAGEKQKKKTSVRIETRTNIFVCEEHFPAVPTATQVNTNDSAFVNTLMQNILKR